MVSKINVRDFYYGAVLSILFRNNINPVVVEGDDDHQGYDLTTDTNECRIFIKHRADKQETRTVDYSSWVFSLTDSNRKLIQNYIDSEYNLVLVLVCGVAGLSGSEIALLDIDQIKKIIGKSSITISRKKNERAYRISTGGGRENAIKIQANRFDKLF